ncbi:hypothetical protein C9374_002397 [Naegleria lovaniensis]|uniref:BRCT domain-containing protein n=1 Tax=Naegleria lovaniensis TaxID=51637 RepID=A0AA88GVC3_NAELO|nr:uncharacterized protein C9374_002397 [Naegleria lovaniensis]KAG2386653.1 hypothetical protein C9374_002397 [Naegleria lovaniensis]
MTHSDEAEESSPLFLLSSTSTSVSDPSPELFKRPQINIQESDSEVEATDEDDDDHDEDVEIPDANSYEEERKRNIERNKMLLANLGLEKGLLPKSESATQSSSSKKRKSVDSTTETRRSTRLSNKPKQTYNYSKIEKEQQRLRKEQERIMREEKLRQKEEEKKRKKYYSRRNNDSDDDSDDSNFVTTNSFDGNGQRRSGRLRNKDKIDYANIEKKYSEVDLDTEDNISKTTTKSQQKKKKRKTSSSDDDMFSECENVVVTFSTVKNIKELIEMVTILKGQVKMDVKDLSKVTHIVCDEYKRTLKTMTCIIRGCHVVTSEWLRASERKNGFLNEKDFVLSCGHDLLESQRRALEQPIFTNLNFYIDPKTNNAEIQTQLIEFGGGNVIDIDILKSKVEESEDLDSLIVIGDSEHLAELKEELKELNLPDSAFQTPEFVYASAVTQTLEWNVAQ